MPCAACSAWHFEQPERDPHARRWAQSCHGIVRTAPPAASRRPRGDATSTRSASSANSLCQRAFGTPHARGVRPAQHWQSRRHSRSPPPLRGCPKRHSSFFYGSLGEPFFAAPLPHIMIASPPQAAVRYTLTRGCRRARSRTEVNTMNANVTIDYATAEKIMDFDGRGGGVLRARCAVCGRPTPAQIQVLRQDPGRQDSDENGAPSWLQLGQVHRPQAAEERRRLVSRLVPRDALRYVSSARRRPPPHINRAGYQTAGTCKVTFEDGTDMTINAGDSYLIDKPHLPEIVGDETVVMHEFSQQVKKLVDSMKD